MKYGIVLVTDQTVEPITLDDCRRQCSLGDNRTHDLWFESLAIPAARKLVEELTGRSFINKTYDLKLDLFPTGKCPIYIPKNPLSSATSITYTDADAAVQTLATSVYKVLTSREPGEIRLKHGKTWPAVYDESEVVTVRFVAGYGATAASVAANAKAPMLLLINHWFENRSAVGNVGAEIELSFRTLIESIKVGDEFHSYAPACA